MAIHVFRNHRVGFLDAALVETPCFLSLCVCVCVCVCVYVKEGRGLSIDRSISFLMCQFGFVVNTPAQTNWFDSATLY